MYKSPPLGAFTLSCTGWIRGGSTPSRVWWQALHHVERHILYPASYTTQQR